MTASSRSETGVNATPRAQGGVKALLRKAVRGVRELMGAWLRRDRPEPTPPQMPMTASSTERMLQANDRLSEWRGVLTWRHQRSNLGDVVHRDRPGPNPAKRFSELIAGHYGPVAARPLTLALHLAHPSRANAGPFPGDSIGTSSIARPPFSTGREGVRRADKPARALEAAASSADLPRLVWTSRPASRGQAQTAAYHAATLRASVPFAGSLKPDTVPVASSSDDVRRVEHPADVPRGREPATAMPKPARLPFLSSAAQSEQARHSPTTLEVRASAPGTLPTAMASFPPSQGGVGGARHWPLASAITRPSIGTHESIRSASRREQGGEIGQLAPTTRVVGPSVGMPLSASPLSLPRRQLVQRSVRMGPLTNQSRLTAGVLPTRGDSPLSASAPGGRLVPESAPYRPVASRLISTPQTQRGRSQSQHAAPLGHGRDQPLGIPRGSGRTPVWEKTIPLARAASDAARLTTVRSISLTQLPWARSAHPFTTYPSAKGETWHPSSRGREIPVHPLIQPGRRRSPTSATQSIVHPEGVARGVASPQTWTDSGRPPALRPTVMGLITRLWSSRGKESDTQRELVHPMQPGLMVPGSPRRGSTGGWGVRQHLPGSGWPRRRQIGSTFRDLGLSSGAALQPAREMVHGQPLAPRPRKAMEEFLGSHLGAVRVHSGPAATGAAAMLKADAFTVGRDIFFGSGGTNFDTPSRMALLGHEATHVVQQRGLQRLASTSSLEARSREREATSNELALRRVLGGSGSHIAGAADLTLTPPDLLAHEVTTGGTSARPSPPQLLPVMLPAVRSIQLARASADREATAQAPATTAPSPSEPTPLQQRDAGEREIDLNAVAQQVYDLIVRRLAVERERAGYL